MNPRNNSKIVLPGSRRSLPENAAIVGEIRESESVQISIRVRRKKSIESALKKAIRTGKYFSRERYDSEFGSSMADMKKVEAFVLEHDLSVASIDPARRTMIVCGTAANMFRAFQVVLKIYAIGDNMTFRGRTGEIRIPRYLSGIIEGIFGLDDRIQTIPISATKTAKSNKKKLGPAASHYTTEFVKYYDFPAGNGSGQCIGLIQLGGGFFMSDMKKYFHHLKLPVPAIKSISVDGKFNQPGLNRNHDLEVTMDIQIAGTVAPKATIAVYFAPNSSDGLLNAITQAIHDTENKPSVISISWGNLESGFTEMALDSINESFKAATLMGITICVATGDFGATSNDPKNQLNVYFPASSPYVLACGGTQIDVTETGKFEEVVWNNAAGCTGGGYSDFFLVPDYQKKAGIPTTINVNGTIGRGIPDLSALADNRYKIVLSGIITKYGGASAVAPLVGGLVARMNAKRKSSIGLLQPILYQNPSVFRDIPRGNNKFSPELPGFNAGIGWDACTGLGAPIGRKLAELFKKKPNLNS